MKNESVVANEKGDGAPRKLDEKELDSFRSELFEVVKVAKDLVASRRRFTEDTYNCRWDGQSEDGRRHASDIGEDARPFEGASDMRIRLAAQITREVKRILQTAVSRMEIGGLSSEGMPLALDAQIVWDYVSENLMAQAWSDAVSKLFHWVPGDAPAAGMLGIFWTDRVELRERFLSVEELVRMAGAEAFEGGEGVSEEADAAMQAEQLAAIMELVSDKNRVEDLAGFLSHVLPEGVTEKTLRRAARDLQRDGRARVPVAERVESRPDVRALRVYEDVFFPANTTDVQSARFVMLREWLSEVELRERVFSHGYLETWVESVLKHEGISYVSPREKVGETVAGWDEWVTLVADSEAVQKGLYEVLTVYHRSVNEDGVPGIFVTTLHGAVKFAARERELLDYGHGKYPFVLFTFEKISHSVWDSKGVPEQVATDQWALKLLNDSFNDHTSLSTVPPIKVNAARHDFNFSLAPMAKIREMKTDEVKFMAPPQYPASNDKHRADIQARVDTYFGRMSNAVPEPLSQLMMQGVVDDQMPGVRETVLQVLQLCGQFMEPEVIGGLLGVGLEDAEGVLAQLRGRLSIQVSFDVRTMNMDWLKTIGDLVGNYMLSWDTQGQVKRGELVAWFASRIDRGLARTVVRTEEEAMLSELEDEDANMAKIAAGIEPPMMTSGQNFRARLERIQENVQKNPNYVAKLDEVSRAILEARVKHLEGQVAQQENAIIGRQMARPALGMS